jgi:hypothetical protein
MAKIKLDKLIIALSLFIGLLAAQENYDTIPKATISTATETRLSVDDGEGMMMSYADANMMVTDRFLGLKERLNSRRWLGYQGNTKLSEQLFFEVAGFNQEAKSAAQYQTISRSVVLTGTSLSILGLLIGVIKTPKNENWYKKIPPVGIGLFATGVGLDIIWALAPRNQNTLSTALRAANNYNKRE